MPPQPRDNPPISTSPSTRVSLSLSILTRFRNGDPDALGEVYDRYQRAVWSVCMSVCRSEQLAQEATQETFIRAWRAAATYDPSRELGPWLLTVARHTTLDLIRRESRPTRGGHEAEQDAVVEDPGMEQAWTAWQVQEAIRRLGEEERQIVRLTFLEDLSQAQIAERLQIPLGTVKSRSHRAHRQLADLLTHLRVAPDDRETGHAANQANQAEHGERKRYGLLRREGRAGR